MPCAYEFFMHEVRDRIVDVVEEVEQDREVDVTSIAFGIPVAVPVNRLPQISATQRKSSTTQLSRHNDNA